MFGKPVETLREIKEAVATYTARAAEKLRRQYGAAQVVGVFAVTNGSVREKYIYNPQTRHLQVTLPIATSRTDELLRYAMPLAEQLYEPGLKYLKAGVMLSAIVPDAYIQGNLFLPDQDKRGRALMLAIDNINFSQRDDKVKYVASGLKRNWKMRQELRSKRYTTRWDELYELR
jgi:DNA polymerase V